MAILFGAKPPGPTRINQVQFNQSVLGYPLPVVMGKGKIQQSILWLDGYTSKLINAGGGKGFGGGKGGTQYVYSADVIAGLCHGPILGVADVWSGQSWLSNSTADETWTIQSGTPYTPVNAAHMTANQGVGTSAAYSVSQTDLGAAAPTVLSGTHVVPFQQVPYGTSLSAGHYSIDPQNLYHFSAADIGKTVQLSYSFALATIKRQQTATVPSTLTIQVGDALPFKADTGVSYNDAGGANDGKSLTRVYGTPTAAGTYSVSGSAPATYRFAQADFGADVTVTYTLDNSTALQAGTQTSLEFSLYEGYPGQAPAAILKSNFPDAALGYSGVALAVYTPMDLGYGAQIQQNVFEVLTADAWGGSIVDCNPIQCILQVLSNPAWGIGFPLAATDTGAGGTWGRLTSPGQTVQDGTASSWFAANGFFISPVIDRQDSAASVISRWLEAGQCAAFMSEGVWKLVPYGDTSTAGNGAVWLAPTVFAAALDDDSFLKKDGGEEPFRVSIEPWQDAYNTVQVSWSNRSHQYASEITPESDQAAIDRYGQRIEDPVTYDFITTLPAAQFAASMRVKRNVYNRNVYEFSLSYRYGYLEPMDVVYVTTSSPWATVAASAGLINPNTLGLANLPVRINKRVDNPDGSIDFTAEDYPFGIHAPVLYNKQIAGGVAAPNLYADPGNSEVVVFEATNRLTGYRGNQIWIGATGANADWGSCNVFASMDGDTYRLIGTCDTPARLGVLGAAFPAGSDPDNTNSLVVNLVENSAMLESATHADADADNTLTYVGGELVSYSAAAVTGQDQVTASGYIRRGRMGSAIAAHPAGALVMRLDDAILQYTYDPSWAGRTIYLKFQSVNVYGNSAQPLSSLSATTFTVPGQNPGTVDASSGLIIGFNSNSLPPNIASNTGNNAVLVPVWNSSNSTWTVDGYGPGGAGTGWIFYTGAKQTTYAAFAITGLPSSTTFAIGRDSVTGFYSALTLDSFAALIQDTFLLIGYVTTGAAQTSGSSGGSTGVSGGGGSTGGSGCTVEGTALDTPAGPVDNRILKARLDAGEGVYLQGRYGPERMVSAEWMPVEEVFRVYAGAPGFECSTTHMLRVQGHYKFVEDVPSWSNVETRTGYAPAGLARYPKSTRVLRIHMEGPSHEYSVHGVWSHNYKPRLTTNPN